MIELRVLGVLEVVDARGDVLDAVLRQPKRLAVLAYLATLRPAPVESRDTLLAMFWPELDQDHARNALNKSLHFLRRTLGEGVVVSHGRSRVGLDPSRVRCDAVALRAAREDKDDARVVGLYLGEFLPGIHLSDVPQFQGWLDQEREWYRQRARDASLRLVEEDLSRGRVRSAVDRAIALDRIAPNDDEVVRATVTSHLRAGDRPRALERLERYEQWLKVELGVGVPAELVRLLNTPANVAPQGRPTHPPGDPPPELLAQSRQAVKVETLDEFRDFANSMPDIAYRCDLRGSFPFVNEFFLKNMGWTAEELRDKSYDELVREDFRDRAIEFYVRQVDERIPITYLEFPAVRKDGTEFWVGQRVRLLERGGVPVGIQAVARDITTRMRRETANRRAALEDRETRLLNREAFSLLAHQRIRENRRSKEPFFVIHVRMVPTTPDAEYDADARSRAVRVIGTTLVNTIREADALGRIDEMEIAILVAGGDADAAAAMRVRVDAALGAAQALEEVRGFTLHCEYVVHDASVMHSSEGVMMFAWVVEG